MQKCKFAQKLHMRVQTSPIKAQLDDQELARLKWAVQTLVLQVSTVAYTAATQNSNFTNICLKLNARLLLV
jgi:hypothetical protein